MNKAKKTYRECCKLHPSIPLFNQAWWLDAVCGDDNWNVVLAEKNESVVGALPFIQLKKGWFKIISMPALTQTMGPWINYPVNTDESSKLSFDKKVMSELITQLPPFDYFHQNFHFTLENWLPFFWQKFKQTTRYTYQLQNTSDLDLLWNELEKSAKKNINKAKSSGIEIEEFDDPTLFYKINALTFSNQNISVPYSKKLIASVYKASVANNAGKMYLAKDRDGNIHSVGMIVYDTSHCYLILGSSDPALRKSGAEYLLYWNMIQFASSNNLIFDFEGSMMENIEIRNRSFGAIQQAYFSVTKSNSLLYNLNLILRGRT